ncbi:hypothetical protein ACM55H_03005, partial [Flavobacterium sp. ZT3R17]
QFTPKLGGQFGLESGGQFAPELVVNLHWKVVVNLTGFSTRLRLYRITLFNFAKNCPSFLPNLIQQRICCCFL